MTLRAGCRRRQKYTKVCAKKCKPTLRKEIWRKLKSTNHYYVKRIEKLGWKIQGTIFPFALSFLCKFGNNSFWHSQFLKFTPGIQSGKFWTNLSNPLKFLPLKRIKKLLTVVNSLVKRLGNSFTLSVSFSDIGWCQNPPLKKL